MSFFEKKEKNGFDLCPDLSAVAALFQCQLFSNFGKPLKRQKSF
jgi:hypothetical protein